MTLKELSRLCELREIADDAADALERIRGATSASGRDLVETPHTGRKPGGTDKLGGIVAEADALEAEVARLNSEIRRQEEYARAYIDSIPDMTLRMIFQLHFLRGLTWSETGAVLGESGDNLKRRCYRYLRRHGGA